MFLWGNVGMTEYRRGSLDRRVLGAERAERERLVTDGERRGGEEGNSSGGPSEVCCRVFLRPLCVFLGRRREHINLSCSNAEASEGHLFAGAVPHCLDSSNKTFASFSLKL